MDTKCKFSPDDLKAFKEPFYQINRKLNIILTLGQHLMENGANSKHILRDLTRCAAFLGISENILNLHISYNTLIVNVNDGQQNSTAFRRVNMHKMDMNKVALLSRLTWQALDQQFNIAQYESHLNNFGNLSTQYPFWFTKLAICIACASLTLIFGGSFIAAFITFISTFTGIIALKIGDDFHINNYVSIALAAFVAMSTAAVLHSIFPSPETLVYAMISCTLFMVPGIPMVNAVDDLFNNYILSGMTRFTHAFFIVCSMTFGIAMALHFSPEPDFTSLSFIPDNIYLLQLCAAFFVGVGFAIHFNAPVKFLPLIGFGGIACVAIRNFLIVNYDFYTPGAVFFAAAFIGIAMNKLASYFDTSQVVLSIPSVTTLIPGILFYRFLFDIIQIHQLTPNGLIFSLQNGITAILIIMSIAVGITVSNIFGQHYMDLKKKQKLDYYLNQRQELIVSLNEKGL